MTAERASRILTWSLDAIAFACLFATGEIFAPVFALAAGLLAWSCLPIARPSRFLLVSFYVALVLGAAGAWAQYRFHPVVAAANAAPIAHALIWLGGDNSRNRSWRLTMGFVALIIASALTPEFYLPVAIVVFVVLGSVALSCSFLEEQFRTSGDPGLGRLPHAYIRKSVISALLIFLTSAIIFPILPRTHVGVGGIQRGPSQTGYTEEVNLSEWTRFSGTDQGTPLLRFFTERSSELQTEIFLGLVRGKVLDHFDGKAWRPDPNPVVLPRAPAPPSGPGTIQVEATREPIQSPILPIPYGSDGLTVEGSDGFSPARMTRGRQWVDYATTLGRARYRFQLSSDSFYHHKADEHDAPSSIHTRLPDSYSSEKWRKLVRQVFGDASTASQKIQKLRSWFAHEGFTASVDSADVDLAERYSTGRLTPLEAFLFVTHQGHCELFASSGAILLRLAGVPTRLIAGFRLARGPVGGVLTVKSSDAHAWFEAWSEDRGWTPLDLTPRVMVPVSFTERFRDAYDFLSGYWSRYVVSYAPDPVEAADNLRSTGANWGRQLQKFLGEERPSIGEIASEHWPQILAATLILITLLALVYMALRIWYPSYFSIAWRVREGSPELRKERQRLEKLLRRWIPRSEAPEYPELAQLAPARLPPDIARGFQRWRAIYEEARFGRPGAQVRIQELRQARLELTKSA